MKTRLFKGTLVSVLLPAYNEAASLAATVGDVAGLMQSLVVAQGGQFEIVIVDDGSADHTQQVIASLPLDYNIVSVRLSRNFGKEAALSAGFLEVRGDVVVSMDADGQHPLASVRQMLAVWCSGVDMVYAVRADRGQEAAFKRLGSKFFYRVLSANDRFDIPANAGDFRVLDRCVVNALNALPEKNRFMKGLYAWVGFSSVAVEYTPLARAQGVSHFSKRRLLALGWTGLTGFSTLPLRAASVVGAALAMLAFMYGLFVVYDKMVNDAALAGWPTIVAGMMFLSGVQLLFVGVLGEYIARIYDEVKARPNAIVANVTRPADQIKNNLKINLKTTLKNTLDNA